MAAIKVSSVEQFDRIGRLVVAILAGSTPDRNGLLRGFQLRLGAAFLSKVKKAYVVKSRGGRGDDGITWPDLSPATVAGRRRVAKSSGRKKDKTYVSARRYNVARREAFARLQFRMSRDDARKAAKRIAATDERVTATAGKSKIAAARLMKSGVDYDILRDTGILFNSLSPGRVNGSAYTTPENQVMNAGTRSIVVGTNVAYAGAHHHGTKHIPRRALWPDRMPDAWVSDMVGTALRGLGKAIELVAQHSNPGPPPLGGV